MISNYKKYLIILSLCSPLLIASTIENQSQLVDIAGQQRMFTQRMLKDYSMIGMNNSFGNPKEDLKEVIARFDVQLKLLMDHASNDEIKLKLLEEKKLWEPIKKRFLTEPTLENLEQFQKDIDSLLAVSHEVTTLFAKESDKAQAEIVNLSGRQRMLSQRMASLYMLKVWGVEDHEFTTKMSNSMKEFKEALKVLQSSPLNTNEINEHLKKVEHSFMFFEIMNRSSTKFIPTLIYKKSNEILDDMNIVTKAYVLIESKK